jgi:hypothetical protein
MAASRYEKYVIRKPAVIGRDGQHIVPEKLEVAGRVDTGPLVWCSRKLIETSSIGVESGIISGDFTVGTGSAGTFPPHKHNFDEMFLFLGTNPQDIGDLGAVAEFWLGEGEELGKIALDTSACVYVPAGLAHFPLTWKNVRRPCIFVVIACTPFGPGLYKQEPVSLEGRPR